MQGDVQPQGLDAEQTLADSDQTHADSDQTASDRDQTASDRDQLASDRDQKSSDRDQATADRDQAAGPADDDDAGYARSRRRRSESSLERDVSTEERADGARARVVHAEGRDATALWRDGAADMRDRIAEVQDEHDAELDASPNADHALLGMAALLDAARGRERAAANRARAAGYRKAAATDRAHAAEDRRQAALDRAAAASELSSQTTDHLTGALRRQVGLIAMQRELDRSALAEEPLVVALIDVDGLQAVNEGYGEAAGDELLRMVALCVAAELGSRDLIARYSGDEFVVSMAGQGRADARARFARIADDLARTADGATITVGLAEREKTEALADVIERAAADA